MIYSYLITHIQSKVRYYGVRYAKDAQPSDLGVKYFSSSRKIKQIIKEEGPEAFTFQVRRTFDSKDAALLWERKFLHRVGASKSPMWFNLHNGGGKFQSAGFKLSEEHRAKLRKPKSEETKQRMRKPKSEEHKRKLAEHLKNVRVYEWSDEQRAIRSEHMKGNKMATGQSFNAHKKWVS